LLIVAVAGFALTGVQSLSRTMIGAFAPPGKSAEFYGFFGMVGRTSSFIGPFLFGWLVDFIADNLVASGVLVEAAEQTAHRQAVFLIVAFLVVGLGLLVFVNEREGRKVALGGAISEPGD
jgi:UMF1 family MFS transporter